MDIWNMADTLKAKGQIDGLPYQRMVWSSE